MWPFKEKKQNTCLHKWVVTENLHVTIHHDTPAYLTTKSDETRVSRVCKGCLKKEVHTVNGHIDYSKSFDIFGGQEKP